MRDQSIAVQSENQPEVVYRAIPGFPGYRVGDDGSVWSRWRSGGNERKGYLSDEWRLVSGTSIRPVGRQDEAGYLRVLLRRNGTVHQRYVQRLVLEVFIGPCPVGMEACHFPDSDKLNNRLSNLRWDTRGANGKDSVRQGLRPKGSRMWNAKLSESDIPEIRRLLAEGKSLRAIAAIFGVDHTAIRDIKLGRKWTHVP